MSSPRLRSASQPWPVRIVLGLFEFLASLKLAVLVISAYVVALVWGVVYIGGTYGDSVVPVAVYHTWWFGLLNGALAVNVLAAALIRIPWKKQQTGFVITHAGILMLMFGSLLSRTGAIDASLQIPEGHVAWRARNDRQQLDLTIIHERPPGESLNERPGGAKTLSADTIHIPFTPGPFNWADYWRLGWFPWALTHRDQGRLWDRDGVRLEALDFLADSKELGVPQIKLRVAPAPEREVDARTDLSGQRVTLTVRSRMQGMEMPPGRYGFGEETTLTSGQQVAFWMTGAAAEAAAFSDAAPQGKLGRLGQVVLHAGGKKFALDVEQLKKEKEHVLDGTGLRITGIQYEPSFLSVRLTLARGQSQPEQMLLFALMPEFNRQAWEQEVYGDYWVDAAAGAAAAADETSQKLFRRAAHPRIDVLQGADHRLHARAWRDGRLTPLGFIAAAEPSADKPSDQAATKLWPGTRDAILLTVDSLVASDKPETRVVGLPFTSEKKPHEKHARALVRLTVDGQRREFWLPAGAEALDPRAADAQAKSVTGQGRRASVALTSDVFDLNFGVLLHEFQRKLDPGTSQASHYASLVDFVAVDPHSGVPREPLQKDVLISMNEPADFRDRATGRTYRLYQESFVGPFKPGSEAYEEIIRDRPFREQVFYSVLAVNYDAGRGWKYLGSLMIVAGIVTLFYMKTYFLRRRPAG